MNKIIHQVLPAGTLLIAALGSGCSNDNNPDLNFYSGPQTVVVATTAADYSSGAHAVFSTESPFTGETQLLPTVSDITVSCGTNDFFRIERYTGENVTRFNFTAPGTPLAQLSTQDDSGTETQSSNPYAVIPVDDTKAYLLRNGSPKAWIINPSASTQAEFKIGELDLSAYSNAGSPNMAAGVIADGKLYIAMQRLNAEYAPQTAYVAVFDVDTDEEIDTQPAETGLKGILLPVTNPGDIEYDAVSETLYVQGTGRYGNSFAGTEPEYTGGIATIRPSEGYATALLVDDGDAETHPLGLITGMEIVSADKGYLIGYQGFMDNTLYAFNPSTGELQLQADGSPQAIGGLAATSLGGLAHDNQGQLWVSVADSTNPGLMVLDSSDDSTIAERLATTLNPAAIAVCDTPES